MTITISLWFFLTVLYLIFAYALGYFITKLYKKDNPTATPVTVGYLFFLSPILVPIAILILIFGILFNILGNLFK